MLGVFVLGAPARHYNLYVCVCAVQIWKSSMQSPYTCFLDGAGGPIV